MRPLFIGAKTSSTKPWWWALLGVVLIAGAAVMSWQAHWVAAARDWLGEQWLAQATPTTLTEPGPSPQVVPAWPEPSAAASAALADAAPATASPPSVEEDIDQQVQAFVERWAASWSTKQLEAYFAAYAEQFQPEGQKSLSEWAKERRQRISSKNKIAVQIKDLTIVSSDHSGLKTSFVQTYEADGFRSTSPKVLMLTRQDGAWKIVREYTP